jgi:branched-chain amino acid transport system ATP-binding protein
MSKSFLGLKALDDVCMDVAAGTITSLIGPNGSGKTTCFNCISGITRADSGRVTLLNKDISGLPPHRVAETGIGRTFQNVRLFRTLSVLDNVMVGLHCRTQSGLFACGLRLAHSVKEENRARARSLQALDFVGLSRDAYSPAAALPYGKKRLVEIARALTLEPTVLLLDEPSAGMNDTETHFLMGLLGRLRKQLSLTIFLVEHDMRMVMSISDWIFVLDYGRLIAQGVPHDIQSNPLVIEAYLGRTEEST